MKLAVLLGGMSPERNISFLSGRAIASALRELGHNVVAIDPARGADCVVSDVELKQITAAEVSDAELASFNPHKLIECINTEEMSSVDAAFIALHGKYGEDGYIQSLLDLRGIPYTGSGMLSSAVTMDKAMSKMLFQVGGITTPHWITVRPDHADDLLALEEIRREMKGPFVVKPNDQGSTVGLTIVESGVTDDIADAIRIAAKYTSTILIERFIEGRELTVAVLGDEALPVIEIEPKEGFYDYTNKYTKGRTEYHCPADLSEEVRDHVMNLATTAHQILGCTAFSRVDFRLDDDNIPFCLEVNTIPGFTETSLVPMSASVAGLSFSELCEEILRLSNIEPTA
jgi:D-alanine-D-alanine ligase